MSDSYSEPLTQEEITDIGLHDDGSRGRELFDRMQQQWRNFEYGEVGKRVDAVMQEHRARIEGFSRSARPPEEDACNVILTNWGAWGPKLYSDDQCVEIDCTEHVPGEARRGGRIEDKHTRDFILALIVALVAVSHRSGQWNRNHDNPPDDYRWIAHLHKDAVLGCPR